MKRLLIFTIALFMIFSIFTICVYAEEEHDHSQEAFVAIEHRYSREILFEDGSSYPFSYHGYPYSLIEEKLFHAFGKQVVNRPVNNGNLLYIIESEIEEHDWLHWTDMKERNYYYPVDINIEGELKTIYVNQEPTSQQAEFLKRDNSSDNVETTINVVDIIVLTLVAIYGIVLLVHIVKSKPIVMNTNNKKK